MTAKCGMENSCLANHVDKHAKGAENSSLCTGRWQKNLICLT